MYSRIIKIESLQYFLKKKNPISAVRVKKFCATTQFDSATIQATGYKAPYSLEKGLEITIRSIIDEQKEKAVVTTEKFTPVLQPNLEPAFTKEQPNKAFNKL